MMSIRIKQFLYTFLNWIDIIMIVISRYITNETLKCAINKFIKRTLHS